MKNAETVSIELVDSSGKKTLLKDNIAVQKGELVSAMFMSVKALRKFRDEEMEGARKEDLLFFSNRKRHTMTGTVSWARGCVLETD